MYLKELFLSVTIATNSPMGHDLVYQTMLRAKFATTWIETMHETGQLIKFTTFRYDKTAEDIIKRKTGPNAIALANDLYLLRNGVSFCIPESENDDGNEMPYFPQNIFACHAAINRQEKGKNGLVMS